MLPAHTDAIDAISGSPERVTEVCETFKHALKHHEQLSKVQDALQSAFASELDATFRDGVDLSDPAAYRSHRNVLEIYAFLLAWFVQVAEQQANAEPGAAGATRKKVGLSAAVCAACATVAADSQCPNRPRAKVKPRATSPGPTPSQARSPCLPKPCA
jgi:hypothetical protein